MTHYADQRWIASVNPDVMGIMLDAANHPKTLARFWSKVDLRTLDGLHVQDSCWIWTGALSSEGYGNFHIGKLGDRQVTGRAHRMSWFIAHPYEIDHDIYLDHIFPICRGRYCVNPTHLEPVTNRENTLRGTGAGATLQRINRSAHLIERDERERARDTEMEIAI